MPVVHCGSVRQAATVVHMVELRPSASPNDARDLQGFRLAPAVAAAAALLCCSPAGAEEGFAPLPAISEQSC